MAASQNSGGAAVAEQHLVAVGQREQRRPGPSRRRPTTTDTGAWRWLVPRYEPAHARPGAATASGRTFDGPEPKRPSPGSRSAGMRYRSAARHRCWLSVTCASMAAMARISRTNCRHRRVRHAGHRRQGQGAQGGGGGRHRLRRRRARLPDARRTSSRPPSPPAATRSQPQVHAHAGPARAARGHRRQDGPRLRLRRRGRPGARHQRRQAGGLQRLRHAARPGRRGARAGAVLGDLSRGHRAGRRRAGGGRRPTRRRGFRVTVDAARGGPRRRGPRCCCSCRRRTRPAPSTRATRSRPSAAGRSSTASGCVTDEIYEHLVYGGATFHSMPSLVPELADTLRRASTAWPRPTP